jgi:hypothetical protein
MSLSGEVLDDSTNHPAAPLYQLTYRDPVACGGVGHSITLADGSDGHTYVIKMVDGNIEVEIGDDAAEIVTLKLADQNDGSYYAITFDDGNLTLTASSAAGAVPSISLFDQADGHTYSLTSVGGALTVTLIS